MKEELYEELYMELALQFKGWVEAKKGRMGVMLLHDPEDTGFATNAMIDTYNFSKMLFSLMKENKALAMEICGMAGLFANTKMTKKECEAAKQYVKHLTSENLRHEDQPENQNLN